MLTHTHSCQYCDRTFSHNQELPLDERPVPRTCLEFRDISKFHACPEGIKARKRIAILLSASTKGCKYGCDRPCNHPLSRKADE